MPFGQRKRIGIGIKNRGTSVLLDCWILLVFRAAGGIPSFALKHQDGVRTSASIESLRCLSFTTFPRLLHQDGSMFGCVMYARSQPLSRKAHADDKPTLESFEDQPLTTRLD